jgi:UDP-glucose 4-epimerase
MMAVGACLVTGYGQRKSPHKLICTDACLLRGTGYIGSFTALALLEAGYKVVITDNLYNSSVEVVNRIELICGKRPEFEQLDITDEKAVDSLFSKHPDIDSVIHFAALKVGNPKFEVVASPLYLDR